MHGYLSVLLSATALIAGVAAAQTATNPVPPDRGPAPCTPEGGIRLICTPSAAEDLLHIPGTDWVLADSRRDPAVALRAISVRDKTVTTIFPTASSRNRHDRQRYGACPGPMEANDHITHGVWLSPGSGGRHRLYAVHHGKRESVEIFEIDVRGKTPTATWVGCSLAPDPGFNLNSVAGLPDGGFVVTSFSHRDAAGNDNFERMRKGEISGELWEYHPGKAWEKVPGSESAGPNGVEISPDGRWLYIIAWGSQSVIRISRGAVPVVRAEVALGFRVDNAKWASDGSLYVAGQTEGTPNGTKAVSIDPRTLKPTTLLEYLDRKSFFFGTTAILLGDEIWVGSTRASNIAVFPVPK